jgi:hypothetical protein
MLLHFTTIFIHILRLLLLLLKLSSKQLLPFWRLGGIFGSEAENPPKIPPHGHYVVFFYHMQKIHLVTTKHGNAIWWPQGGFFWLDVEVPPSKVVGGFFLSDVKVPARGFFQLDMENPPCNH